MLRDLRDPKEARETMLSMLETAGTLAGIGIGLVGFIKSNRAGATATSADDVLLLSALGFLVVCYLVCFAMRGSSSSSRWRAWRCIVSVASSTCATSSRPLRPSSRGRCSARS